MNENWQIALFTILGGGILSVIGAGTLGAMYFNTRLTRIETVFELAGAKAFKSMHRDGDDYKLDGLIEKYEAGGGVLTVTDWITVKETCDALCADRTKPKADLLVFAMAAAFATHKIMSAKIGTTHAEKLIK